MKSTFCIIIGLILFSTTLTFGQTAPLQLQCVNRVGGSNAITFQSVGTTCPGFVANLLYASNTLTGGYTLLTSFSNPATNTYTHNLGAGSSQNWYYYLVQDCSGVISPATDTLDDLPPASPLMTLATVQNGVVSLFWQPSPSPEAVGYVILLENPVNSGFFINIDTVYNGIFTYTDYTGGTPDIQPERYCVAAIDDCGEVGLRSNLHQTMYLAQSVEPCDRTVTFTWNEYADWQYTTDRQIVFLDGLPVDTFPAGVNSVTYQVQDDMPICCEIHSYESVTDSFSVSNELCFTPAVNREIDFLYLDKVSVDAVAQQIQTAGEADNNADYQSAVLQYSYDGTTFYDANDLLPSVPIFDVQRAEIKYDSGQVFHRVKGQDLCGNVVYSDTVATIFLQAALLQNFSNQLYWTEYKGEHILVSGYRVWKTTSNGVKTLLATVQSDEMSFVDQLDISTELDGNICYEVEAIAYNPALGATVNKNSFSNTRCVQRNALLHFPNAINPQSGTNGVFKPIAVFGSWGTFEMQIYNRWGALIFSTNNINDGWNGSFNEAQVQSGVYSWTATYTQPDGTVENYKGFVTVVR